MKIAFDQQVFLLQEYGGISRYVCNLAAQLSAMPETNTKIFAPLHFNQNLKNIDGVKNKSIFLPKLNTKFTRLAMETSKFLARSSINRFSPDILHETYFTSERFQPVDAKCVLTVYDMIHEQYPDMFDQSQGTTGPKKQSALRADHVICISENTRRDLIEIYDIPEEKTSVVYLGVDQTFKNAGKVRRENQSTRRPFVLYVGNRSGHKNFEGFLSAFSRSEALKSNYNVLCFGGDSFTSGERELITALRLTEGQVEQQSGGDQTLAALYGQAEALVYPSLYEGFGIPPLEAMAANCPVICSNSSSLPEVVGGAAELFDPTEEDSIIAALENVMHSPSRREQLIAAGKNQYRKFSWEKCARETMDIYRMLQ